MNYAETSELFEAMDNLEMYTRLFGSEMDEVDIDLESLDRYRTQIKVARETIFKIATTGKEL